MSTIGRSESINAFVKQYVTQKNGLCGYMFWFEQGIATQKYRQLKAIHDTSNGRPKLKTDLPMEKQMSQIYTKKMFYKFQDQFMYITSSIAKIAKDDMEHRIYNVSSFKNNNEIQRSAILKEEDNDAKCSCQLFEFKGILTKGRSKRMKSSKEKARKKDRLCHGCGKRGVAHDMRRSVENNFEPFNEYEASERCSDDETLPELKA